MSEQRAPFVTRVLGRVGPAFGYRQDPWDSDALRRRADQALSGDDEDDLSEVPAELLSRLDLEVPRIPGLAAALLELGGLPDDDLPEPPRSARRGRVPTLIVDPGKHRGSPIAESRLSTLRQALPGREYRLRRHQGKLSPASSDDDPDLGIEEPPGRVPDPVRAGDGIGGDLVDDLARRCQLLVSVRPRLRYVWDQRRRWMFDLAWPHPRLAVLIDGGRRIGGRVVYGAGWIRDAELLNEATIDGWMVLRVTVAQIESGAAVRLIARALASPWKRL